MSESLDIQGFTNRTLGWKAWLPTLDPAQASPAQQAVLEELAAMRPQQPRRMGGQRRGDDIFMPRWNLVVPLRVAERRWEEPA